MRDIQDFDHLMIKLASPDTIRAWSYGEVKKPETINYRTLRPEKDGLFCERIFGTTKEWECYCGKFKSIRYKGVICDRCGVEVTHFKVRRERMGHIELAAPVSHIWYYRSVPSRMSLLLDLPIAALRSVLYYEKYIVIDAGDTDLKKMQLLTEEEYNEALDRYNGSFSAGMGAEAVKTLLETLDLDALAAELRVKMIEKGSKSDKRLLKRIEIVENFRTSTNKCSWMILDVIPVIPPELRPMVQLDGGRFATSDLNDLYRRVINRNNRLKRLQSLQAPDIIIRNEKRMLQEAVDALFDNSKRKRAIKGSASRPLKSISDMLKGKQGRFRQNLLGKRVDYSGRSVIIVGPELKLWQCGLPTKMALELFKPFIMKKLVEKDIVYNIKKAKLLVEQESHEVFEILDEVVREHPVMLNRAPTLHRLGIQAFEPVLVEGKAIRLHPLVCHAFNADFDGDQMAIHVPLTQAAQMECWTLMLSARNLLDPANGKTIVYPSQDMVLGIYYLTKIKPSGKGTGKRFSSIDEVMLAAEAKSIDWQTKIRVPATKDSIKGTVVPEGGAANKDGTEYFAKGDVIETTAGRLIFNEEMPADVNYVNGLLGDKDLKALIEKIYKERGPWLTVQMLDAIKAVGYKYATFFGATLSMEDIIIPAEKSEIMSAANKEVEEIVEQYNAGVITQDERYNKTIEIWGKANEDLTDVVYKRLGEDKEGFNTIYMMASSGARGSKNQIRQLAGMRGLMAKPNGDIIELPIRANFKEGLSVIEFFISTNGARKGLTDTALKTADAGYLTRRLVDIAHDVVVNEEDCGTINGIEYTAIKDGDKVIEALKDRIVGRFTLERVVHPITHQIVCDVNEYITEEIAAAIEEAGVESVKLRSVLTCESRHGVCCKCYGRNLAHNKIVEIGEAVGIIAAQSIGQPGTQLTMRTFHVGGTASTEHVDDKISMNYPIFLKKIEGKPLVQDEGLLFTRKGWIIIQKVVAEYDVASGDKIAVEDDSKVLKDEVILTHNGEDILAPEIAFVRIDGKKIYLLGKEQRVEIGNGSTLVAEEGSIVPAQETIATFDPYSDPIIAEVDGYVYLYDVIEDTTFEIDSDGQKRITDLHLDTKEPRIEITDEHGSSLATYYLPAGSILLADDGMAVKAGTQLAKMSKESAKTNDITGGLPRVSELFEARKPKSPAILSQITGTVKFNGITKGKRNIQVIDKYGKVFEHLVPMTKRLLVRDGDSVESGEQLCAGSISAHDVLAISGENALQRYLMNEIQSVYRAQGVSISDKHIGVIVRQMLRKVEIVAVGDTHFIYGQQVDKYKFHEENDRVLREGGQAAVARPMFQGITKASLNIDSFISAASFQETTRVLTNAAIAGGVDNLRGLKENVIIGHLIPAGTGMKQYRDVKLFDKNHNDLDIQMNEILERQKQEADKAAAIQDDDASDTE